MRAEHGQPGDVLPVAFEAPIPGVLTLPVGSERAKSEQEEMPGRENSEDEVPLLVSACSRRERKKGWLTAASPSRAGFQVLGKALRGWEHPPRLKRGLGKTGRDTLVLLTQYRTPTTVVGRTRELRKADRYELHWDKTP